MSAERTTRRAYNKVYLPNGRVVTQCVVVTDADGQILDCYPLDGEQPFVEWIGGTMDLRT